MVPDAQRHLQNCRHRDAMPRNAHDDDNDNDADDDDGADDADDDVPTYFSASLLIEIACKCLRNIHICPQKIHPENTSTLGANKIVYEESKCQPKHM